jgi:HAE1 family hydrophobic/amphiphilic exporter-1
MFSAGIVMLGVVTLLNLSIDFLPAIDVPTLTIQTAYPDTSPEEVEGAITDPIESTLGTIAGVKRIRSITREGMSIVTVTFYWGTNMDFAVLGVREKLDKARGTFPREAGRPTILRLDPSADPVMTVAISSPRLRADSSSVGLAELKETARALLKRRIEQVESVAQASVLGGIEREIQVDVDMAMLNALGLDCGQLGDALGAANVDLPGGTVKQGHFRYSLKTLGSLTSIEDIRNVIVRSAGSGRPVRVADCATVREAFAERSGLTRFNGQEVIVVQVRKEAGANTVAVSRNVHTVLSQLQQENPDLGLSVIADQAEFVRKSIADVEQAILTGGVLAFLVLFAFLRQPRYPLIIGLTMPVSVLATIVAMYFLRINLNIISLTGLALGIGMLGDNAIVLVENVSRLREQGIPIGEAALRGAREIGTAVTASTLTNVVVFLPIVFVEGVAAQLFVDMGVTMTISLMVSLLAAVTLVPMLVSREARGVGAASGPCSGTSRAMRASPAGWSTKADMLVRRGAEVYIVWALEHRPIVVLGSLGLFLVALLVAFFIPAEPAPDIDQNRFLVQLRMPRGTSLEGVGRFSRLLESELRSLRGVSGVYARIGITEEQAAWNADDAASESADLDVQIERAGLTPSLMDSARALLKRFALVTSGIEYAVKPRGTSFERILRPEANDIRCMILGKDPATAARCAAAYANAIRPVRGLVDLRTSLQDGTPAYHITIDREAAARHGLNVRSVAAHVTQMVRGNEATSLNDFGRKIAVRVQPPGRTRNDLDAILDSFVPAGETGVPLRTFVTWKETKGYAQIWRENQ